MNPREEHYVIRGGKEGYDRLLVLARSRWPDTLALLRRAGLAEGMRCLDVGCGGGAVTLEIARLVGPHGAAVGVDMDAVKLDLARQAAAKGQLENVTFQQTNVNDWDEPGRYDAVYSRFLLQHLRKPVDLLRRMWAAVRPGGMLIVEDADFDGWCCDPPNEAFEFFVRNYEEVARHNGGDATFGRKLYRAFLEAEIPEPSQAVVQTVWAEGEAKRMPWLTLEFTSEAIVSAGLATLEEVEGALTNLAGFLEDRRTIVSGPRVFQVWSRRPALP